MKSENFASLHRRTIIFTVIISSVLMLGFRLFQMQILNVQSYEIKASDNSVKGLEIIPLRGIFYDRNMKVVVSNYPAYTVRITPAHYNTDLNHTLEVVLEADSGYINQLLQKNISYSKYLPIKVKRGVDFKVISWLEENSEHLPGVDYIIEMHRDYPSGMMGSHMFGYTKEITADQLQKESDYYKQGDFIGYNGIEKTYEKDLRGEKGIKYVVVDSKRKEIGRHNQGKEDLLPLKGKDLILTIDAEVQHVAEEEFKGKRGALVAIEPSTGEILALVSAPEYDLTKFSYITPVDFLNRLYNDPEKPLFNRATMSVNAPGSTFKPLEALMGLDMGVITPSTTIICTGGFTYGRYFKCHGSHGVVNVTRAIEKSCNVFFYKLIYKIGLDKWKDYASLFGFNSKTNIDIGEEVPGFIPDEKYYEKLYGPQWPRSIMASLGIGQGEVSVTPLQLAQYTALVANYGKSFQPHLVKALVDEITGDIIPLKSKEINVNIDKDIFDIVREGMYLVVNGSGTATHIRLPDIEICGKTGTAQNPGEDHALFIAFAPYENPKIALAVIVENVGFGGTHAAPIAKKVIETYLRSLNKKQKNLDDAITSLK